jgi:hypothetical protein
MEASKGTAEVKAGQAALEQLCTMEAQEPPMVVMLVLGAVAAEAQTEQEVQVMQVAAAARMEEAVVDLEEGQAEIRVLEALTTRHQ